MSNAPAKTPLSLEDLRARREEILTIARRHKAYNVRVFGSVARGEAGPDSDVDLLVNFREGASLFDVAGLYLDLKALLGVEVDIVEDHAGLRERFRTRVVQEMVAL